VGRLGLGPSLWDRIELGVRVSAGCRFKNVAMQCTPRGLHAGGGVFFSVWGVTYLAMVYFASFSLFFLLLLPLMANKVVCVCVTRVCLQWLSYEIGDGCKVAVVSDFVRKIATKKFDLEANVAGYHPAVVTNIATNNTLVTSTPENFVQNGCPDP